MSKNLVQICSWIAAVGLLAGCSVKNAPPIIHKGPVDTQVVDPQPTDKAKPNAGLVKTDKTNMPGDLNEKVSALAAFDLESMRLNPDKNPPAQDVMKNTVIPLSHLLISPVVYSVAQVSEMKFFDALREFHAAILYVNALDPSALQQSGILQKYKEAIFFDCDAKLQGSCANLKVYTRETRFPRVLDLIASQETDVVEYYRILRTVIESRRAGNDSTLDYLYLRRANELARYYSEAEAKKSLSRADIDELRTHARLTQNILVEFDPKTVGKDKLDELMKSFNPWDMSRKTSDVLNFGMDRLLNLAAQGYLYDEKTGKLNSDFVTKVNSILAGKDELYGYGMQYLYDWIGQQDSKGILKNLGLVGEIKSNEYTYLVDRIYYSHFNSDDAIAFWKYTNQDRTALFEAINQFIRLQIAYKIVWTNQQMNQFFKDNTDKFDDIFTLLSGAVSNSLKLHAEWDRTLNRMNGIMNFVDHEYGSVDVLSLPPTDPYRALTDSMNGLQHNIKMLSVYPNMMMLVYLMAKKNFQATIDTYWGTYTITPDRIIEWFFVDVLAPWFSFGTDNAKLTQVELLYALHFTLQTETFSAFQSNPLVPINTPEFFREITEKLTNSYVQTLKDRVNAVNAHLSVNNQLIRDAVDACQEEKQLQPQEDADNGKLLPRSYVRNIAYGDLKEQLANGFGNDKGGYPLWALSGLHSVELPKENMLSNLTSIRSDIEARLLALNNMKGILITYLSETGGDVDGVSKAYNDQVAQLTNLRNQYLLIVHQSLQRFGNCDYLLYKHEMDLRNEIYRREEAYLGGVYENIQNLNGKAKQEIADGVAGYNKTLADEWTRQAAPKSKDKDGEGDIDLPAKFVSKGGYDRYAQNSAGAYYEYFKFDALLRARRTLSELSPGATKVILPNFEQMDVEEYQSPVAHPIEPWSVKSKQEFIDDGMRQFVLYLGVEDLVTPHFLLDRMDTMAQLYRIGPIDAKDGTPGCVETSAAPADAKKCLQVTPQQLIDLTFTTLQAADTSAYDVKVLGWLARPQKHDDKFWAGLAMESDTRRPLGLLDMTFQRITSDGDELSGAVTSYFLDVTKQYYITEISVGNFFFQPSPKIESLIKANYSQYVYDYEDKTAAFLKAYAEFQKTDKYKITQVRRSLDAYITVPTETVDGQQVQQYLSPVRLNRYTSLVNLFNAGTEHAFER